VLRLVLKAKKVKKQRNKKREIAGGKRERVPPLRENLEFLRENVLQK